MAETQAIELTIHTAAGPFVIPLEADDARAILGRFGPPMRDGNVLDMAAEPMIETGRFLGAVWMHERPRRARPRRHSASVPWSR